MKKFTINFNEHILSLFFISIILALLISNTAFSQIIYVDSSATGVNNGSSWKDAYTNLQTAIDSATNGGYASYGGQIWVAKGTYFPVAGLYGFEISQDVSIYGGFAGTETKLSERKNYGHGEVNETILSGNTDNVVSFYGNVSNNSVFSGFTITNGSTGNGPGGIWNQGSPIIEDCIIFGNGHYGGDSGVDDDPEGGDISPIFVNCIISDNNGGGILNNSFFGGTCDPTFINCIISGNYGPGISNYWDPTDGFGECNPVFVNCTITGNNIPYQQTGYLAWYGMVSDGANCDPILQNCIIWNNGDSGTEYTQTIENNNSALPSFSYSIIEGCYQTGTWDTDYGTDNGSNLDQDPSFVTPLDPATTPSTAGDFHLQAGSPALDAGTPASQIGTNNIPANDIEGNPRPLPSNAPNIDMGAYEEDETALLPVELKTFTASVVENEVELKWNTATEVNNYGFKIQRRSPSQTPSQVEVASEPPLWGDWGAIGFVKGHGNSNSPKQYSFVDSNPGNGKVEYRLKQIDNDGSFKYSKTIELSLSVPAKFALMQNYPNPFNPTTTIKYEIPKSSYVTLKVYDILGNVVKELVNKEQQAGRYSVQLSAIGSQLSSGVYFYQLKASPSGWQAGGYTQTKKMILLK